MANILFAHKMEQARDEVRLALKKKHTIAAVATRSWAERAIRMDPFQLAIIEEGLGYWGNGRRLARFLHQHHQQMKVVVLRGEKFRGLEPGILYFPMDEWKVERIPILVDMWLAAKT